MATCATAWPGKYPDEVLDYLYDWSDRLTADNDTILGEPVVRVIAGTGSAVIETNPPPAITNGKIANGAVVFWVGGGIGGEGTIIQVEVSTAAGRTYEAKIGLPILN